MPPHPPFDANMDSAASVFEALADRLPPPHKKCVGYSEFDFSKTEDFKQLLAQDNPIIANYTNFWLGYWDRRSDFFVTWTFGFLGALVLATWVGGALGLIEESDFGIVVLGCIFVGLGVALRYSQTLAPMAERSVILINGQSGEFIYACRVFNDEPVERLVRVPFRDLVVKLSWGQIADHSPSFISVTLGIRSNDGNENSLGLCLATVDHYYFASLPEELLQKAKDLAESLGATYDDSDLARHSV